MNLLAIGIAAALAFVGARLVKRPRPFSYIAYSLPRAGAYSIRDFSQVNKIIIHHTAGNQTVTQYAAQHIGQGWPGIGYHFFIDKTGKAYQTNDLNRKSYHNSADNERTIGIALQGNFNQEKPTAAQLDSLLKLVSYLKGKYPQIIYFEGHGEQKPTSCPGANINPELIRQVTGLKK